MYGAGSSTYLGIHSGVIPRDGLPSAHAAIEGKVRVEPAQSGLRFLWLDLASLRATKAAAEEFSRQREAGCPECVAALRVFVWTLVSDQVSDAGRSYGDCVLTTDGFEQTVEGSTQRDGASPATITTTRQTDTKGPGAPPAEPRLWRKLLAGVSGGGLVHSNGAAFRFTQGRVQQAAVARAQ
ncbi:hypothetical protein EDB85DRAFT_1892363 [Lactarius pseudohatsudake]|nr:hypothetical protein EDB85DRAFT_1892363 [Lactarius pseudohatsudake]